MEENKNTFILAGNGPYENRGCEAIARGTTKILRHYFDDPKFTALSFYSSKRQFEEQVAAETDRDITHKKTFIFNRAITSRLFNKLTLSLLGQKHRTKVIYGEMIPYLEKSCAVLSVGGDNYSFDYGKPVFFTDLDELVLAEKKPLIIWGASVGPFSKYPRYESYMKEHFHKITGIFARETITVEYLASIGITKNVYRVADPAFLMDAVKPPEYKFNEEILNGAIGINLSPLMADFVSGGNLKKWAENCVKIIKEIANQFRRPIFLIPHVTSSHSNDYTFMKKILSLIDEPKNMISLLPDNLSAGETKWIISKMFVFIGSRTHSVISALSSGVPALSLVYSIKGKGIIRDFYNSDKFFIEKRELTPDMVVQKTKELIKEHAAIKGKINSTLPNIERLALSAGKHLKDIIGS